MICAAALAKRPLSTKELAPELMKAKGMDLRDGVLAKAIGHRLMMGFWNSFRRIITSLFIGVTRTRTLTHSPQVAVLPTLETPKPLPPR